MEASADVIERLHNTFAAYVKGLNLRTMRETTALWIGTLSDTFVHLLSEKRPPTLILKAHYCHLLKYFENCWYMEQRSYYLFEASKQSLGG